MVNPLPPAGSYKKFTKDHILILLSESYPLTIKEMRQALKQRFRISVTYQAVRKSVRLLEEGGAIVGTEGGYRITHRWIQQVDDFLHGLKRTYSRGSSYKEKAGHTTVYHFRCLAEMNDFWREVHLRWLASHPAQSAAWWGDHCWWIPAQVDKEDRLKKATEKQRNHLYFLNNGSTALDKWAALYYQAGAYTHYRTNRNRTTGSHIVVLGDKIMQIRFPENLVRRFDEFYKNTRVEVMDIPALMRILNGSYDLEVHLTDNPVVATELRKSILSHFG